MWTCSSGGISIGWNCRGRVLQKAVGGPGEGRATSTRMTVGFARYSAQSGPMEPHHHAEETIYVVDARDRLRPSGDGGGSVR
jgi:hypothetical protein